MIVHVFKTSLVTVTTTVAQACASQTCLLTFTTTCACSLVHAADEFIARVFHLRQCHPLWSQGLVIMLSFSFRGVWTNWLRYKSLSPNVPTLVH